jgi:hypothetical protein
LMAQHLWRVAADLRLCEVCLASQRKAQAEWPWISPICPGDDDDGGRRSHLAGRRHLVRRVCWSWHDAYVPYRRRAAARQAAGLPLRVAREPPTAPQTKAHQCHLMAQPWPSRSCSIHWATIPANGSSPPCERSWADRAPVRRPGQGPRPGSVPRRRHRQGRRIPEDGPAGSKRLELIAGAVCRAGRGGGAI